MKKKNTRRAGVFIWFKSIYMYKFLASYSLQLLYMLEPW